MRLRSFALGFLGLASLLPGVAPAAKADVTTAAQSASIPLTSTNWSSGTISGDPMTFTKFDPSLGSLKSVNVTLGYAFTHDLAITFVTPADSTVSADQNVINLARPDNSTIVSATPPTAAQELKYGFNPGETVPKTFTFPTVTNSATLAPQVLTSAADLALFTGTGASDPIHLPVSASAHSNFFSSSGNGSGSAITKAGADVSISYTYATTAVPEPASVVLLGCGAGGLLFVRKRRGRSSSR